MWHVKTCERSVAWCGRLWYNAISQHGMIRQETEAQHCFREDDVDYQMMLIPSSYSKIKACNVVMMKMLMMTTLMIMNAEPWQNDHGDYEKMIMITRLMRAREAVGWWSRIVKSFASIVDCTAMAFGFVKQNTNNKYTIQIECKCKHKYGNVGESVWLS